MKGHQIMQNLSGNQSEAGGQASSKHESNPQSEFVSGKVPEFDNEGKGEAEINRGVAEHHYPRGSRSTDGEKGRHLAASSAAAIDVIGVSSDELADYAAHNQIHEKNASSSAKNKGIATQDPQVENVMPDNNIIYGDRENCTEPKGKREAVSPPVELEYPEFPPPANCDEMAVCRFDSIGFDPKPFDPDTYEAGGFCVTDGSGSKRHIPDENVVRWRKVKNPDGTTSVESNARFVEWSDESLQLFIGNKPFDVIKQDTEEGQNHLFREVAKGTCEFQGRIPKKLKIGSASLPSESYHPLNVAAGLSHEKIGEAQEDTTDVDAERMLEQVEKIPEGEQVELEHGHEGNEVEGSTPNVEEEMREAEEEEPREFSDAEEEELREFSDAEEEETCEFSDAEEAEPCEFSDAEEISDSFSE